MRPTWTVFRLIGQRHLRWHWKRTLLSLFGIAASVTLIVAVSIINATLQREIDSTGTGIGGRASLAVTPLGPAPLGAGAVRRVRRLPGVGRAIPIVLTTTRVSRAGTGRRVLVLGIPPSGQSLLAAVEDSPIGGRRTGSLAGIALSARLASALGAGGGEGVAIETPRGSPRLPVAAVMRSSRVTSINGGMLALLSLRRARHLFDRPGVADAIYVFTRPGTRLGDVRRRIQATIGPTVLVGDPGAEWAPYRNTFNGIASLSRLIQVLSLAVMVFLVFNAVAMSVSERARELSLIGMLGVRARHAATATVLEAVAIGLLGGALGVAAGFLVATLGVDSAQSAYRDFLPTTSSGPLVFTPSQALLGLACGVLAAILGTALALRRITTVEPIDLCRPTPAYGHMTSGGSRSRLALGGAIAVAVAVALGTAPGGRPWIAGPVLVLMLAGIALLLPSFVQATTSSVARAVFRPTGAIRALVAAGIRSTSGRARVTVGAVAVSAATVVAISTAFGSLQREVERVASGWYEAPLYVKAPGSGLLTSDQPLPVGLGGRLAAVEGVRAAYPMRYASVNRDGRQMTIFALPIAEAAKHGDELTRDVTPDDRALIGELRHGAAMVSRLTARRLHVGIGDSIDLPVGSGLRRFRVVRLLNDLNVADSVYLDQKVYERDMRDPRADRFAIEPALGQSPASVRRRLERFLRSKRISAGVATGGQVTGSLVDALRRFFSLARGVELAALLIAAMVIANTMLTVTFERRHELGIQRTLGMSRLQLASSLVLEAALLAGMGATIACALGLVLASIMTSAIGTQLAWDISFRPSPGTLVMVAFGTVAVGAAAALVPGWLSTRLSLIGLVRDD